MIRSPDEEIIKEGVKNDKKEAYGKSVSHSRYSVKTRYNLSIFTLQRGLASSLLVGAIFLPHRRAKFITLQRDVEAHIIFPEPISSALLVWGIKGEIRAFAKSGVQQESSRGDSRVQIESS